ncbi:phosphotransferase family protein [Nocardioides anomalus]|uniref:Phosphotransferase family protein n=1 Tax=Nocardioides anomalus TaxID=2712223 RepID=A0A6G6W945_9ACTN|nr:phosphotransferase family protein [Nocardioides anomalus]QIG41742.1 phosphotransferase family protein [Nocardioides anomalus]
MTALSSAELAGVAQAMAGAGEEPAGPLRAELIAGGRSNLTFGMSDGVRDWVLRTPPRTGRTPSAHDVVRELRIVAGLAGSGVPVPRAVVAVEDETLLGGPFAVTARVRGRTVQSRDDLDRLDDATVAAVVDRLLETLVRLHHVDLEAAGLAGLGRADAYAERQLRRWSGQWEIVGTAEHEALAREVVDGLRAAVPPQHAVALLHGDYRIDNTLLDLDGPEPVVTAVLDWELSALGDPVADVAVMCAYREPAFDLVVGVPGAWTSDRLPPPADLAAAYEAAGGVPLRDWETHRALACLKIAVIAAGIDHRARAGSGSGPGFDTAGEAVGPFLELARDALGR